MSAERVALAIGYLKAGRMANHAGSAIKIDQALAILEDLARCTECKMVLHPDGKCANGCRQNTAGSAAKWNVTK